MNLPRPRQLPAKRSFAAQLRADATDAERILWAALRSKQIGGLRFRRQQPIGPYVVDFFCPAAKLVLELDGDQHGVDAAMARDGRRTRWLMERGYRVLRFAKADAFRNQQYIIDSIVHHLEEHPSPKSAPQISTLPQGEGD